MLPFIIFGLFVFFACQRLQSVNGQGKPWLERVLKESLSLATENTVDSTQRNLKMGDYIGKPWEEWEPEEQESILGQSMLQNRGSKAKFYGPMRMDVAGDEVLIFDWKFEFSAGEYEKAFYQTVVSIKPDTLDIPPFIIRPKTALPGHMLSTVTPVRTGTMLDIAFDVQSLFGHRTKLLFQSEYGTTVLVPFLIDQKWTLEWTGERLIAYTLRQLIDPDYIPEYALEVSEFFDLLKDGPVVIEKEIKRLIQTAHQKM